MPIALDRRDAIVAAENLRLVPEVGLRRVSAHRRADILPDVLLGTDAHVRRDRQRGDTDIGQA